MKIISIAAAVLAVAIATVQAVPVPDGGLISTIIRDNDVNVRIPVNVDAHDIKVLKRHTVNTEVKENDVNVNAPVDADLSNLRVLSKRNLVNTEVKDNNVDVKVPVNADAHNLRVLSSKRSNLVNTVVNDNNVDVKVPVNVDAHNAKVLFTLTSGPLQHLITLRTTAIATTAILWFGGIVAVASLHVASAGITCHEGSAQALFNPGVTFAKKNIQCQSQGNLGVCSDLASKITGGAFHIVGSGMGVCPSPLFVGNGKAIITWNTGERSIIPQANIRAETSTVLIEGRLSEDVNFAGCKLRMSGRVTASAIEIGTQCITSGVTNNGWAMGMATIECE
ncbi:hypothetical protein K457DRAFT_24215 [Linnemannia elongata AG-77]|uniref:Uncharacterized protein n=1 Tax=Linnemannia elongata AG-77 TaxID=1314771 RepID=A0A197JGT0_9FUNG|nr:hypothetical protein K457DRAFT_24215 [Linnemannia elongata AG-77]